MACRLVGTNSLSVPCWHFVNWTPRNKVQLSFNPNSCISIKETHFKTSFGKWRRFCFGLNAFKNQPTVRFAFVVRGGSVVCGTATSHNINCNVATLNELVFPEYPRGLQNHSPESRCRCQINHQSWIFRSSSLRYHQLMSKNTKSI